MPKSKKFKSTNSSEYESEPSECLSLERGWRLLAKDIVYEILLYAKTYVDFKSFARLCKFYAQTFLYIYRITKSSKAIYFIMNKPLLLNGDYTYRMFNDLGYQGEHTLFSQFYKKLVLQGQTRNIVLILHWDERVKQKSKYLENDDDMGNYKMMPSHVYALTSVKTASGLSLARVNVKEISDRHNFMNRISSFSKLLDDGSISRCKGTLPLMGAVSERMKLDVTVGGIVGVKVNSMIRRITEDKTVTLKTRLLMPATWEFDDYQRQQLKRKDYNVPYFVPYHKLWNPNVGKTIEKLKFDAGREKISKERHEHFLRLARQNKILCELKLTEEERNHFLLLKDLCTMRKPPSALSPLVVNFKSLEMYENRVAKIEGLMPDFLKKFLDKNADSLKIDALSEKAFDQLFLYTQSEVMKGQLVQVLKMMYKQVHVPLIAFISGEMEEPLSKYEELIETALLMPMVEEEESEQDLDNMDRDDKLD